MAKIISKQKINFYKLPSPDKSVVIMDTDEFEDLLEQTDRNFQKSLKKSLEEYRKGKIYKLEEI